jgi:hypothetical protein
MEFVNQRIAKNRGYALKHVKQMHFARHGASLCVAAMFCLWLCTVVWLCEKRLEICLEGYTKQEGRRERYKILGWEHRGK